MNSGCRILVLLAVFMILSIPLCRQAGAEPVTIHYSGSGHEKSITVPIDEIEKQRDVIRTIDPNFKDDGVVEFRGVSLKNLLEPEELPFDKGLTVVGHDQYIGFVSPSAVNTGSVIAACRMDGLPIPPRKGGPVKIIYAGGANMPRSAYTWYVRAIYAGRIDNPVLTLRDGPDEFEIGHAELDAVSEKLEKRFFSSPAGFRADFREKSSVKDIRCAPLARIFNKTGVQGEQAVEFIPSAGPSVTVPAGFVDNGIRIIYKTGGKALHPAFGGPYSVVFPMEKYPEMIGRVPESGALFFVKKIIVY